MREVHGIRAARRGSREFAADETAVVVTDKGDSVALAVTHDSALLTPDEARYIADRLLHLAHVVEARGALGMAPELSSAS